LTDAFGIIRNHPFPDGNKRTGFLAAYVFLDLNGWELKASEFEAVVAVSALAAGEMDESGFADWLKSKSVRPAVPYHPK
jgi:death on curing protein